MYFFSNLFIDCSIIHFIKYWFSRAADGIKIINQLNDDVFTTVIKYVHKNMSLSGGNATPDTEDDGGLEK